TDELVALESDTAGNVYVAGNADSGNISVAKFDQTGSLAWPESGGVAEYI
ncbi:MAG: hypothetical protein GWO08_17255, partial [Gammaproteobacteria bacterium]|nr:hypothetical protein [Gammaproteobacteria bacterium]NIR95331.1 hypothetical protein [Gammaproteobacteria bacterium]